MPKYSLFGGTLDSEIELPSVSPVRDADATWTLRRQSRLAEPAESVLIGEQTVEGIHLRVYRHAEGFRLHYSHTGVFDISSDGSRIEWVSAATPRPEDVRNCVLGYVFNTVLHAAGTLCLHGSAVEVSGRAIAFMAPRFFGKSTLALALASVGARLITDDTILVRIGPPVTVRNGEHIVRLFPDSRDVLFGGQAESERRSGSKPPSLPGQPPAGLTPDAKDLHTDIPPERLAFGSVPLDAIYQLWPVPAHDGDAARRQRVPSATAVATLVGQVKMGHLLGRSELPVHFDRAARIASVVPVFALEMVRDFERLPEAVSRILSWHSLPNDAAA
jgi:hypothetical protein